LNTPTDIARTIYRDLAQSPLHNLPTEEARERYSLWGDRFDAVIAASGGHLFVRPPGLLAIAREQTN
jgi:hypothetical protein